MVAPPSKPRRIAIWVVSALLAFVFLSSGAGKVLGTERSKDDFARWGYPDWFRPIVGAGEILGALLLLIPNVWILGAPLRFWGAAGLSVNMVGGFFTHLRIGEYAFLPVPLALFALTAFVAWSLRPSYLRLTSRRGATKSAAR